MRSIIFLSVLVSFCLNGFAQVVVVNCLNKTVSNVEFLNSRGELYSLSDNNGVVSYLMKDSVYRVFHPNYKSDLLKYNDEDTVFLGEPVLLFEEVNINEEKVDLYSKIYDSTYMTFVNQEIYLMGEMWIYQKIKSLDDSSVVIVNKYKLDVAYMKSRKKKKKEYWGVKGDPERSLSIKNEYLDSASYVSRKDKVQKALPPPFILTGFFRQKKWLRKLDGYSIEHSVFGDRKKIELIKSNKRGFTNSHDITYYTMNYRCNNFRTNNYTGEDGVKVMNSTIIKPLDSYYCNFVSKNGYYYPELMVVNYKYSVSNNENGNNFENELVYLFKVNEVSTTLRNSEDYIEQNFKKDKYLRDIIPNRKDLMFPFYLM